MFASIQTSKLSQKNKEEKEAKIKEETKVEE